MMDTILLSFSTLDSFSSSILRHTTWLWLQFWTMLRGRQFSFPFTFALFSLSVIISASVFFRGYFSVLLTVHYQCTQLQWEQCCHSCYELFLLRYLCSDSLQRVKSRWNKITRQHIVVHIRSQRVNKGCEIVVGHIYMHEIKKKVFERNIHFSVVKVRCSSQW
jgi:hypothetical protein